MERIANPFQLGEELIEELENEGAKPDLEESLLNLSVSNAGKSKFKPIDSSTPIKPRKSLPKNTPSTSPFPKSLESSSRSNSPETTK